MQLDRPPTAALAEARSERGGRAAKAALNAAARRLRRAGQPPSGASTSTEAHEPILALSVDRGKATD